MAATCRGMFRAERRRAQTRNDFAWKKADETAKPRRLKRVQTFIAAMGAFLNAPAPSR